MPATTYSQFCALARALELLGERWTLLIVRELLLGPKRFSDLRDRLGGVSPSVLAERLARLEDDGLISRRYLEPPAVSTVYELSESGLALEGAVFELIRWGARFLFPQRPGERFEPDWLRLVFAAYARKDRSPAVSVALRVTIGGRQAVIGVAGGRRGTVVTADGDGADVVVDAKDPEVVLGLMSGSIDGRGAIKRGEVHAEGDVAALALFPQLFGVRR